MRKFAAVVKHEYKKVVLKWSFLIATLLLPLLAVVFSVVPMIIFAMKGEPTRIAVASAGSKTSTAVNASRRAQVAASRAAGHETAAAIKAKDLAVKLVNNVIANFTAAISGRDIQRVTARVGNVGTRVFIS